MKEFVVAFDWTEMLVVPKLHKRTVRWGNIRDFVVGRKGNLDVIQRKSNLDETKILSQ